MVFGVFGKGVLGKKQVFSIAFLFAQEVGVNNRVFFFSLSLLSPARIWNSSKSTDKHCDQLTLYLPYNWRTHLAILTQQRLGKLFCLDSLRAFVAMLA